MHFLVRRITGGSQGEALETEYQAEKLTLGSDENNTVQLRGLAGQLSFKPVQGGGAKFATSGLTASIDGSKTRKAVVTIGDQLKFTGYNLKIIAPPQGFEFALQIESEGVGYADGMDLQERAWSMRRSSWIGALLVLVLCLILPALVLLLPENARQLRQSPLPDDGLWSSGPLSSAHSTIGIGSDCQACHQKPFVMVTDDACLNCHRSINEHVDIDVHEAAWFSNVRCASCHREHNEPARLVRSDNTLCVDCHSEPERWKAGADGIAAVTAFTADAHPEFRLDLLIPLGPGGIHGWEVQPRRQSEPGLEEQSNLKFNHTVHLDVEKVRLDNSGEALSCDSCHLLTEGVEHFETITMDNQCRSCHALSFDIFEPELELPHGDLRGAIVAMEAHFIREFTDPILREDRAAVKDRRIPGRRLAAASCTGSGLDCGRAEALKEAQFQFAETGCITCHEVTDTGRENIQDRWFVPPVNITGDWFQSSRFSHAKHLNQAFDDAADICLGCHEADISESSTDILMPARAKCLDCHGQGRGETAVSCVDCHAFHQATGTAAAISRGI